MSLDIVSLVVLGLATWRVSHMLAHEHGPGNVLDKLRVALGAEHGTSVGWYSMTFWGALIICPLCLSVSIALLLYLLVDMLPAAWPIPYVLAISGLASLSELAVSKR